MKTFFEEIYVIEDCSLGRSEQSSIPSEREGYVSICSNVKFNLYLRENYFPGSYVISFNNFLVLSDDNCQLFNNRSMNFHPSPLPHYGGVNPISWGLLNGEDEWGYTWHRISKKIDAGEILFQNTIDINNKTQESLMVECIFGGLKALRIIVKGFNYNDGFRQCKSNSIFKMKNPNQYYSFHQRPTKEEYSQYCGRLSIDDIKPLVKYEKWRWL